MVKSGSVRKPNNKKRDHKSKGKRKDVVAARDATNNVLAKLKMNKANNIGTSSSILIYVIEFFTVSSNTWVFDTGCGYHIISVLQEPEKWKKLKQGDMELIVDDGKRVPVLATGTFCFSCPSGLAVTLNNCLFTPGLTKNIISVSSLFEQGFKYVFNEIPFLPT